LLSSRLIDTGKLHFLFGGGGVAKTNITPIPAARVTSCAPPSLALASRETGVVAVGTKKISILKALWLGLLLLGSVAVRAQTVPLSDLDALRYIASHPDLVQAFGFDAAKGRSHYETWGIKEGRKITFEPLRYTASHPDLIRAFGIDEIKAVTHYIEWGFKEQRATTLFDPVSYLARYADLRSAFGDDLKAATRHYIQFGYAEGRLFTPILNVELEFSVDRAVVLAGQQAVLTWTTKNSSGCTATGAWSGLRPTQVKFVIASSVPGRFDYTIDCRGTDGSARKSLTVVVAYPVFSTSYDNKNSLAFDETQLRNLGNSGLTVDKDERGLNNEAAFADFFSEGRMGAFYVSTRFRGVYSPDEKFPAYPDSPAKVYFLSRTDAGAWIDRTQEILPTATDRDACVTPFPIVSDFNKDNKPDVFVACRGILQNLPGGENSANHPKYSEIYLANQLLYLSTAGKTYRKVVLPFRLLASTAAAADIDRDGNADIAIADGKEVFILFGNGDGGFRRSDPIIPRKTLDGTNLDNGIGGLDNIHLIPLHGRIDLVLNGYQGSAWFQGSSEGFDTWTMRRVSWPISSRNKAQYSARDVVHTRGQFFFYLTNYQNENKTSDAALLQTDFSSRHLLLYPVAFSSGGTADTYQQIGGRIKIASDGSIIGYAPECFKINGLCTMRVTAQSVPTLVDIDALKYIASHPDLISAFGADSVKGRAHFEQWGWKEGRKITFDPLDYVAANPDLITAFGVDETKAVTHYINFGFKEGRRATPFDALGYTASYGDVIYEVGFDAEAAVKHYILFGYAEGRKINFDGASYLASHGDLIDAFKGDVVAATKHYVRYGFAEGRRIIFDALAYIASHIDLARAFGTDVVAATKHYIQYGYQEGRRISFNAFAYLASNADLRSVFGADTAAATRHYINWGFTEKRLTAAPANSAITRLDAHRFLVQATFGPRENDIRRLLGLGYSANGYKRWIDEQIDKPMSLSLAATIAAVPNPRPANFNPDFAHKERREVWAQSVLYGEDQLRQRVAFALSQIMVVSGSGALFTLPWATADYYDMLVKNALGNYRKLLEDVTLHPAMGIYLSALGNQKAVEGTNLRPDENYAREMMQLFSIGLVQLNSDGSRKLDVRGQSIPTYDQATISGFARIFTGWKWQCSVKFWPNGNCGWNNSSRDYWPEDAPRPEDFNQRRPMKIYEEQHEQGVKQLLKYPGVVLPNGLVPAGQGGTKDLKDALDNVFYHPNVGPFISKQLIQKLVGSNPSPEYVGRVAGVFNDDGTGVRGNLRAVVTAILLDPEARNPTNQETSGKLKEPILRLTQIWRAYNAASPSGSFGAINWGCDAEFCTSMSSFGQSPLDSPSVFNFFSPFYSPPGEISRAGLVAPEMQLANENMHTQMQNFVYDQILQVTPKPVGNAVDVASREKRKVYMNIDVESAVADDTDKLLDVVAERLLGDPALLSQESRAAFRTHLATSKTDLCCASDPKKRPDISTERRQRQIGDAILLIATSPEYAVQQ